MCKVHTRGVEMEEAVVEGCVFSPGGDYLAVYGVNGEVKIWDSTTKSLTQRFRPGNSQITCIAWSKPQNSHKRKRRKSSSGVFTTLAVAAGNIIHIWNVTKGEKEKALTSDFSTLTCLESGPNDVIFSGSCDNHVTEWNITTEQSTSTWKADRRSLQCMCCHDNGELLLTAGSSIKLWNLKDYTQIKKFTGHASYVRVLQFIEDTHFISCAENDRVINIWSMSSDAKKTSIGALTCEDDVLKFDATTDPSKQTVKVVALSQEGTLHMFSFELTNQITAPVAAQSSVQFVATATKDSTPAPLPVLAARLNQSSVGVAYGSILRPSLESLDFDQSEERVCLFREAPVAGGLLLPVTSEKGTTTSKSPAKKVTILGPGNMSIPVKKQPPSSSEVASGQEEASMSERLGETSTAVKDKTATRRPSAGQLSTLLSQAVANGNNKLLEDVLRFRDTKIVMATVRGIPLRDVLPLLRRLIELLQTSPARGLELSIWLKAVLQIHAMYLTSIPHVLDSFSGLYQLLDSRVNTFPKLCRLQGKLDLLVAQCSSGGDRDAGRKSINTPLVTVTLGESSSQLSDESSDEDSATSNDDWNNSSSLSEDESDVAMETDPSAGAVTN